MIYNHKCGEKIDLSAKYDHCPYCGESIEYIKKKYTRQIYRPPKKAVSKDKDKPTSNAGYFWIILLGIIFLLIPGTFRTIGVLLIIGGIIAYFMRSQEVPSQSPQKAGISTSPYPQIGASQYQQRVTPQYKQPSIVKKITESLEEYELPKWNTTISLKDGIITPLNHFDEDIKLIEEKRSWIENYIDIDLTEKIQTVEETTEFMDDQEHLFELNRIQYEIQDLEDAISLITKRWQALGINFNKLDVQNHLDSLRISIDEMLGKIPDFQAQYEEFPISLFEQIQLKLGELSETNESIIQMVDTLDDQQTRQIINTMEDYLKNLKVEISSIPSKWQKLKNKFNGLDLQYQLESFHSTIDEITEKLPEVQILFDESPMVTVNQLQSALNEVKESNNLAIQKLKETIVASQVVIPAKTIEPVIKEEMPPPKKIVTVSQPISKTVEPVPLKMVKYKTKEKVTPPKKIVAKVKPDIEYKTSQFRLKSILSRSTIIWEKIISNLFAYIGAAILIFGISGILIITFKYFIEHPTKSNSDQGDAIFIVIFLYLLGSMLMGFGYVLNKKILGTIRYRVKSLVNLMSSVGLGVFALSLYAQTAYTELKWTGYPYVLPAFLIFSLGFTLAYLQRSKTLSFFSSIFGLYIGFTIFTVPKNTDTELFIAKGTIFNDPASGFIFYLLFLLICAVFAYKQKIWYSLGVYSLLSPILFLNDTENVGLPGLLLLGIAITNVGLVVTKKMGTTKSFAHFLGTVFLIYPNIVATQFSIPESDPSNPAIFELIVVFSGFFALYWILVFFEKELDISFVMPVSISYSEEEVKMRPFYHKLNWIMLSSLLILVSISINLAGKDITPPLLIFATLIHITAIIGLQRDLDKLVSNSFVTMLISSQILAFLYLSEGLDEISPILSIIFLLSLPALFIQHLRTNKEISLLNYTIFPRETAIILLGIAFIDFFFFGLSDVGAVFILVSTVVWMIISLNIAFRQPSEDQKLYAYLTLSLSILVLFFSGLFHSAWKDEKSDIANFIDHLSLNLALFALPVFAFLCVINGDKLTIQSVKDETTETEPIEHTRPSEGWKISQFIRPDYLYLPQITFLTIPFILAAFGTNYFYPSEGEVEYFRPEYLIPHFIIYFLISPLFIFISLRKKNHSFGVLTGFISYYLFFASYAVINIPIAEFYEKYLLPGPEEPSQSWRIFLGICLFMIHLLIMIKVANRVLYPKKYEKNEVDEINIDQDTTKQTQNAVETATETNNGKKEEIVK